MASENVPIAGTQPAESTAPHVSPGVPGAPRVPEQRLSLLNKIGRSLTAYSRFVTQTWSGKADLVCKALRYSLIFFIYLKPIFERCLYLLTHMDQPEGGICAGSKCHPVVLGSLAANAWTWMYVTRCFERILIHLVAAFCDTPAPVGREGNGDESGRSDNEDCDGKSDNEEQGSEQEKEALLDDKTK